MVRLRERDGESVIIFKMLSKSSSKVIIPKGGKLMAVKINDIRWVSGSLKDYVVYGGYGLW